MEIVYLPDRPGAVPTVAEWYFRQWGHRRPGSSVDEVIRSLQDYLHRDRIPLMLLATESGSVVGAAQLKLHEVARLPERVHWLGGVFITPHHRGRRLASRLVQEIERVARDLTVETLHLQTDQLDGGLYARLGWRPALRTSTANTEALIMEKDLRM